MKLQLEGSGALNAVTGYGAGYVMVNGERHETNLVVLPERVMPWSAGGFETLAESDFEMLAALGSEVVLLGTGVALRFPAPRLTRALAIARIGLEVMDTQAACRTYNILMAEERRVAAALLLR